MATSGAGSAQEGTEGAEGTQDPPQAQPDAEGAEGTGGTDELSRVRREAAQRRVQLRETEGKLEQATAQIAAFQRSHVEGLVAAALTDPADLWKGDVELDTLLNDEGVVDPEKVTEAVKTVTEAHPAWRKAAPDFGAGARGQGADQQQPSFRCGVQAGSSQVVQFAAPGRLANLRSRTRLAESREVGALGART